MTSTLVNGDCQNLNACRIETPKQIAKKVVTVEYFWEMTPMPNFAQICPRGLLGKWVKYN